MKPKNSLEVKLVKFSKTQLESKLEKEKDPETIKAIQSILNRRNGIKEIDSTVQQKEVVETKKENPKKLYSRIQEGFNPVVTSKDKDIQFEIDQLQKLNGHLLEDLKEFLSLNAIDVQFISFLQKGDVVEFKAAKNSKLNGSLLSGVVVGNKDLDKYGRKFCKIRVEGKGTFQKLQTSVIRISNNELA